MNKRWSAPITLAFVVVLTLPCASFAQIRVKVIVSGGFSAAFQELLPEFEKTAGITVTTTRGASQGNGPDVIGAQLRRGVPADVVIMSREGLDELIADGRIVPGTDVDLAQSPLGMSVRAGAPKPDISTVEGFKQTLLRAKSVTFPSSTTGIYLVNKLFPQLGIANEMAGKVTNTGVAAVAKGDAEIAVQPRSELLHVPGVDFVGTIPAQVQYISVFSAAVVKVSKEPKASKQLIAYLSSENARTAIKNSGMEPPRARKRASRR
jgi:molybdate transport system substrate-binding protein